MLALPLLCFLLAWSAHVSLAATINVDSTCTLVQAINSANGSGDTGSCETGGGADTITFQTAYSNHTISATQTISSDITITANDENTIYTSGATRHFTVNSGASLTLNGMSLQSSSPTAAKDGGALLVNSGGTAILNNSTIRGAKGRNGGGIYSSGTVTITGGSDVGSNIAEVYQSAGGFGGAIYVAGGSLTINGNSKIGNSSYTNLADSGGGSIYVASGNVTFTDSLIEFSDAKGGNGGAFHVAGGSVTITNSRIRGNDAEAGGGGGIHVSGGTLNISSTTLDANEANGKGGGIAISGGSATVSHVTLYNNLSDSSTNSDASGIHVSGGSFRLRNSIIGSTDGNADCGGNALAQNVGNLIEDNTCSPQASGSPDLNSNFLVSYFLPNQNSPALGIGDPAICKAFPVDQRGITRPEQGCDAGSVERDGFNIITVNANANNSPDTVCTLSEAFATADDGSTRVGCNDGESNQVATDLIKLQLDVTLTASLTDVDTNIVLDGGGYKVSRPSGNVSTFSPFTVTENGDLTMRNITIENFSQTSGGGVLNKAKLTLEDCVFKDNTDTSNAGGGGAVRVEGTSDRTLVVDRCLFKDNTSSNEPGAAIKADGGDVTIRDSSFIGNNSPNDSGAAIYFGGGSGTVHNNTFSGNTCSGSGCAVFNNGAALDLTHNTFWDNTSSTSGNTDTVYHGSGTSYWRNSILGHSAPRTNPICGGNPPGAGLQNGRVVWNGPEAHGCGQADVVTVGNPNLGAETGSPPYLPLGAGSSAIGKGNATYCAAVPVDAKGDPRPAENCDAGAVQRIATATGEVQSSGGPYIPPTPIACTGEWLNANSDIRVSATYDICSGINFERRELSAIGIQWVIDAGPLDVVDVWGWVRPTAEVCFPQLGSMLSISASMGQRVVQPLPSYRDGQYTCAQIGEPALLVLLQADSPHTTAPSAGPQVELAGCMVRTKYILNLREAADGDVITLLPYDVTLTAFSQAGLWYEVDYHGARGWVSGAYVEPMGNCG